MFANHSNAGAAFSNFFDEQSGLASLFCEEDPCALQAGTTTTPAQPNTATTKYPENSLMGIPTELRLQIFGNLTQFPTGTFCLSDLKPKPRKNILFNDPASAPKIRLDFLRTNRQIYGECSDIIWKENAFKIYLRPDYSEKNSRDGRKGSMCDHAGIFKKNVLSAGICNNLINFQLNIDILGLSEVDGIPWIRLALGNDLGSYSTAGPKALEETLLILKRCPNLKKLTLQVDKVFDNKLDEARWIEPKKEKTSIRSEQYWDYIKVLSDAGGNDGYLSHLEKSIQFTSFIEAHGSEATMVDYMYRDISFSRDEWTKPLQMFKEISTAFGATVWLDGAMTHDSKGNEVGSIFTKVWDDDQEVEIYHRLKGKYWVARVMASEYLEMNHLSRGYILYYGRPCSMDPTLMFAFARRISERLRREPDSSEVEKCLDTFSAWRYRSRVFSAGCGSFDNRGLEGEGFFALPR